MSDYPLVRHYKLISPFRSDIKLYTYVSVKLKISQDQDMRNKTKLVKNKIFKTKLVMDKIVNYKRVKDWATQTKKKLELFWWLGVGVLLVEK